MLFCYIDESGVPQIPGNTSHYVLAGIMVKDQNWKKCEHDIQEIKEKYALQNAEIHTGWILRRYKEQESIPNFNNLDYNTRTYEVERVRTIELLRLNKAQTRNKYRQAKKNYKQTLPYIHLTKQERESFIFEIAKLVGTWGFCRLFAESIDKTHFVPAIARGSVEDQAFEQLVTRFEKYLQIFSRTNKKKEFGILVHDNNDTVKNRHTALMKNFHNKGTFWVKINNTIETPFFVDSQFTSMVQIADVCAYAIRRYCENNDSLLFTEIFKRADTKNGKVVGVRHFSNGSCNCIICQTHK